MAKLPAARTAFIHEIGDGEGHRFDDGGGQVQRDLGAGRLQMSTLRRRINQRDWEGAVRELSKWIHAGGKVLNGLVVRRHAEALMLAA